MGVFPFYTKAILIVRPLFSLAQEAQTIRRVVLPCIKLNLPKPLPASRESELYFSRYKTSLAKKKRRRRVSLVATSDQRSARWIGGRFLKKATKKLSTRFALTHSLNQNLNTFFDRYFFFSKNYCNNLYFMVQCIMSFSAHYILHDCQCVESKIVVLRRIQKGKTSVTLSKNASKISARLALHDAPR